MHHWYCNIFDTENYNNYGCDYAYFDQNQPAVSLLESCSFKFCCCYRYYYPPVNLSVDFSSYCFGLEPFNVYRHICGA